MNTDMKTVQGIIVRDRDEYLVLWCKEFNHCFVVKDDISTEMLFDANPLDWLEFDVECTPRDHMVENIRHHAFNLRAPQSSSNPCLSEGIDLSGKIVRNFSQSEDMETIRFKDHFHLDRKPMQRGGFAYSAKSDFIDSARLSANEIKQLLDNNIFEFDGIVVLDTVADTRTTCPWTVDAYVCTGKEYGINGFLSKKGKLLRGPNGVVLPRGQARVPPDVLRANEKTKATPSKWSDSVLRNSENSESSSQEQPSNNEKMRQPTRENPFGGQPKVTKKVDVVHGATVTASIPKMERPEALKDQSSLPEMVNPKSQPTFSTFGMKGCSTSQADSKGTSSFPSFPSKVVGFGPQKERPQVVDSFPDWTLKSFKGMPSGPASFNGMSVPRKELEPKEVFPANQNVVVPVVQQKAPKEKESIEIVPEKVVDERARGDETQTEKEVVKVENEKIVRGIQMGNVVDAGRNEMREEEGKVVESTENSHQLAANSECAGDSSQLKKKPKVKEVKAAEVQMTTPSVSKNRLDERKEAKEVKTAEVQMTASNEKREIPSSADESTYRNWRRTGLDEERRREMMMREIEELLVHPDPVFDALRDRHQRIMDFVQAEVEDYNSYPTGVLPQDRIRIVYHHYPDQTILALSGLHPRSLFHLPYFYPYFSIAAGIRMGNEVTPPGPGLTTVPVHIDQTTTMQVVNRVPAAPSELREVTDSHGSVSREPTVNTHGSMVNEERRESRSPNELVGTTHENMVPHEGFANEIAKSAEKEGEVVVSSPSSSCSDQLTVVENMEVPGQQKLLEQAKCAPAAGRVSYSESSDGWSDEEKKEERKEENEERKEESDSRMMSSSEDVDCHETRPDVGGLPFECEVDRSTEELAPQPQIPNPFGGGIVAARDVEEKLDWDEWNEKESVAVADDTSCVDSRDMCGGDASERTGGKRVTWGELGETEGEREGELEQLEEEYPEMYEEEEDEDPYAEFNSPEVLDPLGISADVCSLAVDGPPVEKPDTTQIHTARVGTFTSPHDFFLIVETLERTEEDIGIEVSQWVRDVISTGCEEMVAIDSLDQLAVNMPVLYSSDNYWYRRATITHIDQSSESVSLRCVDTGLSASEVQLTSLRRMSVAHAQWPCLAFRCKLHVVPCGGANQWSEDELIRIREVVMKKWKTCDVIFYSQTCSATGRVFVDLFRKGGGVSHNSSLRYSLFKKLLAAPTKHYGSSSGGSTSADSGDDSSVPSRQSSVSQWSTVHTDPDRTSRHNGTRDNGTINDESVVDQRKNEVEKKIAPAGQVNRENTVPAISQPLAAPLRKPRGFMFGRLGRPAPGGAAPAEAPSVVSNSGANAPSDTRAAQVQSPPGNQGVVAPSNNSGSTTRQMTSTAPVSPSPVRFNQRVGHYGQPPPSVPTRMGPRFNEYPM